MSTHLITAYSTGIKRSYDAAVEDLEAFLETQSSGLTILDMQVVGLRRDRQDCIGWLLLRGGLAALSAYHGMVSDNVALTAVPTVASAYHAHASGPIVLTAVPVPSSSYHVHTAENLTVTT